CVPIQNRNSAPQPGTASRSVHTSPSLSPVSCHPSHLLLCALPLARLFSQLTSALRRIIFVLKPPLRPGKRSIVSVIPAGIEHLCREDKQKPVRLMVHLSSSPVSTREFPERKR